jgi:hypothetical protein
VNEDKWYYDYDTYCNTVKIINKNKDYYSCKDYSYKDYSYKDYYCKDYSYKRGEEGDYPISLKDQKISDSDCRTSSEEEKQKALERLMQG